jgi:starch synthase
MYSSRALLESVRQAAKLFRESKTWQVIQKNGMAKDFSWKVSAQAYVTLYEAARKSRIPLVTGTSKA